MTRPDILEKIDELFGESQTPDLKKMETLISETLKFFEYLREKMQSPDEEEKKEALEIAQKLQQKLEGLAEKSLTSSGMSREQLYGFLTNPSNFSKDEWSTLQNSEKKIDDYQKELKPKKKIDKSEWLKS